LFFILTSYIVVKHKFYQITEISPLVVRLAFTSKILAGILLWYIYTYYYSNTKISDLYKYFEDGNILATILKNDMQDFFKIISGSLPLKTENVDLYFKLKFWVKPNSYGIYNDNQTIILVNCILSILSNNNILTSTLIISFLSFTASIALYKVLSPFIIWKNVYFAILFLTPSIVLWTSGLLKETLVFISVVGCVYHGIKSVEKFELKNVVYLTTSCFLLLISKTYFLGFLFPSIICVSIITLTKTSKIRTVFISMYCFMIMFFLVWSLTHNPVIYDYKNKTENEKHKEYDRVNQISYSQNVLGNNYNLLEMLRFKQADYKHEARAEKAKSLIETKKMDGSISNLIACIPFGISNGFTRPHIFEANSFMVSIPAVENVFFLILLILSILFHQHLETKKQVLVFGLGTFIVLTYLFLGLLVPVLGNLVRYKAPLLPLLYFCVLIQIDSEKIISFWSKIKRSKNVYL
jgi:hypothetical protein